MSAFFLEGSPKTPHVNFDPETGLLELKGRSIPENSIDFYKPLIDWLDKYGRSPQPTTRDLQEIAARCSLREVRFAPMVQDTKQETFLNFGPRWKNLRQVCYGKNEVLAMLELPEQFSDDLTSFTLHPALMELATSAGRPLVEGYETSSDFYVPLSYKKVQVNGPLPRRIYNHVRHAKDGRNHQEVPAFDLTITRQRPGSDLKNVQISAVALTSSLVLPSSKSPMMSVRAPGQVWPPPSLTMCFSGASARSR